MTAQGLIAGADGAADDARLAFVARWLDEAAAAAVEPVAAERDAALSDFAAALLDLADAQAQIVALEERIADLEAPAGFKPFYSTDFATNDGFSARTETQSNDGSYNHPDNVAYTPRGLVITGKREELGGRPFTTADVLGQHIAIPNYFRIDVEATLPTEYGMWPCPLWLRPANSNNGGNGELDACETWTYDWGWNADKTAFSNARVYSTMWRDYTTKQKQNAMLPYSALPNPDPAGRHKYSIVKTPGRLEYLVDDVRVYCWETGKTYSAANKIGPPPSWFNSVYEVAGQTWYPRFTLQIGGPHTADPLPSWAESELIIHKMRVYVPA